MSNNEHQEKSLAKQKDGFYGRFEGLVIFSVILLIMLIPLTNYTPFKDYEGAKLNFYIEMLMSFLIFLPIGFSAALSIKTKGLDLSVPAMVMVASRLLGSTDTLLLGIVLAFSCCIAIGAINAVIIYFSKLPGLLVTFIMSMFIFIVFNVLPRGKWHYNIEASRSISILLVIVAAVISVIIAIMSSKSTKRIFLTSLIPVYAGSGMLSVLYVLAHLFASEGGIAVYLYGQDSIATILLIGIFFSITRFTKNKLLALVLVLLPCIVVVLSNIYGGMLFLEMPSLLVLIMIVLVYDTGRAELIGQSHEKSFIARGWIALIPLVLLLVRDIVSRFSRLATSGASKLFYMLNNTTVDIMLVVVAVGMGVLYFLENKRDRTLAE